MPVVGLAKVDVPRQVAAPPSREVGGKNGLERLLMRRQRRLERVARRLALVILPVADRETRDLDEFAAVPTDVDRELQGDVGHGRLLTRPGRCTGLPPTANQVRR